MISISLLSLAFLENKVFGCWMRPVGAGSMILIPTASHKERCLKQTHPDEEDRTLPRRDRMCVLDENVDLGVQIYDVQRLV